MRKVVSILMVLTLLISTLAINNINTVQAQKSLDKYSGEELFEGVLFGYGEVSELFPEMWENSLLKDFEYTEEQIKEIKNIEKELRSNDPEFFNKFKEGIQSGDHLTIEQTILTTEKALEKIFAKEIEVAKDNEELGMMAIKPGFAAALAYAYIGATHIAVAAVMVVVIAGIKVVGPKAIDADDVLSQEVYIDQISEKLSVD